MWSACGPRREADRHPLAQRRGRAGTALAYCADGYVLACALFIICWITMFSAAYAHSGDDPAAFGGELIHPLADLLVLGGILPLAVAAGRRGAAALAALLLITLSDALAVGARVSNGHPGTAAQLLLIAGLGVLGAAPWLDSRDAGHQDSGQFPAAGRHATTIIATSTAALAALVLIGAALAGGPVARPVLAVAAGTAILALTSRIVLLVHRDRVRARLWHESGQQFRELADRTSDVVLVCGYSGLISYASPAVRDYGYAPDSLEGMVLTDLVHPEDQPDGQRAVREAAGQPSAQIRYSCRVRAADGTWRYVEATISRHRSQGAPDRLLVTARDVSDLVALRRQIAQLTYHDGLTGLPNRAYLEDRAREALSLSQLDAAQASGAEPGLAGVILVDLDGFTGVNDMAGPSAGDLVLAQVARRLRAVVPPRGTVARWGGDEFAVLITGGGQRPGHHRPGRPHPGQPGRRAVPRRRPGRFAVRQRRGGAGRWQPGGLRVAQRRRRGVQGQAVRRRAAGGVCRAPGRRRPPPPAGRVPAEPGVAGEPTWSWSTCPWPTWPPRGWSG